MINSNPKLWMDSMKFAWFLQKLTLLEGRLSVMKNGWICITLLYGNSIHGKTHLVPD